MRMKTLQVIALGATLALGHSSVMAASGAEISSEANAALQKLYASVPAAKALGAKANAILVFPKITKAGLGVGGQFGDGAKRLVDRDIGIGGRTGIRVRDRDASKRLPSDFMRRLPGRPLGIVERVVFVPVPVRPAIDGDGLDVARRVEAAIGQHPRELLANPALERGERRLQQLEATRFVLLSRR